MRNPVLAAAALLAILIAIYGPGIGKGFVKDDVVWVSNNHVTSWSDVRALLVRTDGFYRPLVAATFAIDRAIYGLEPFGFGVSNLLLLMLGALALVYLGITLGLRTGAAIVAAGIWALNFHAVNMAVLWLSGRTALCVAIAAFLSAAALVKQRPFTAGAAALLAMCAKEEAVLLPVISSGWAWVLSRNVVRLTGPTWAAAAIYLAVRMQTPAMTPLTATDPYQFVRSPVALAGNALEYLDRACTYSLIVLVVAHVISWRRPVVSPDVRQMLLLAAIWFMGTFALTIFVPNRSSLYALLPSAAPALVVACLLQQLWDSTVPATQRRLVAAAVIVPWLLLPVYWTRNTRWVDIAELSSDTFAAVRRVARERPDVDVLLFRDDPATRRSFAGAYDQLLPVAVRLAAGRDITVEIDSPDDVRANAARIVLREGKVLVE